MSNNYDDAVSRLESALPTVITRRASAITPQPIRWLWPGRLALGKLSLIAGDPGLGKSQLTLDMVARVTTGRRWPADNAPSPSGSAMIVSAEDDPADTIIPRLIAAGADLDRVHIVEAVRDPGAPNPERQLSLARDLGLLEDAMPSDCVLVIVDPISAYLGGTDSHSNADLRELLAPLAKLAQRRGVAMLAVSHLNKAAGQRSAYRVTGSIAFTAAARAVYLVAQDQDDPKRRLVLPIKNNLGDDTNGLAYRVQTNLEHDAPFIEWEPDLVTDSADDVMGSNVDQDRSAGDEAKEFLLELLADGPVEAKKVKAEAGAAGIAWRTVERAKGRIGVRSERRDFSGGWVWTLQDRQERQDRHPRNVAFLGESGGLRAGHSDANGTAADDLIDAARAGTDLTRDQARELLGPDLDDLVAGTLTVAAARHYLEHAQR
jgi:putative DNA primase/helicase